MQKLKIEYDNVTDAYDDSDAWYESEYLRCMIKKNKFRARGIDCKDGDILFFEAWKEMSNSFKNAFEIYDLPEEAAVLVCGQPILEAPISIIVRPQTNEKFVSEKMEPVDFNEVKKVVRKYCCDEGEQFKVEFRSELHPHKVDFPLIGGWKNKRRNRRRGGGNRRGRRRNNNTERNDFFPPLIRISPISRKIVRYGVTVAAAVSVDVTFRCLLNTMLMTTNGSAVGINMNESMQVDFVSMYFAEDPSVGFNILDFIELIWKGQRGPDKIIGPMLAGGSSRPAKIYSKPPKQSLCGFWGNNGMLDLDDIAFTYTAPIHTIIDVGFKFTTGFGTTRTVTLTVNATITGVQYAPLDNAVVAGTVGLNNTVAVGVPSVKIFVP